jgi:hypothetical protein
MMKKILAVLVLLCVLLLAACGASAAKAPTPTGDAPGYWQPYPIGSGTCIAHGVTGVPDGTKAPCQEQPTRTPSH